MIVKHIRHPFLWSTFRHNLRQLHLGSCRCAMGGTPTDPKITKDPLEVTTSTERIEKISTAMRLYLERSKAHKLFIQEKNEEFERGKRHLANMMGWDPESITQDDIDSAIQYLLPSALFSLEARPMMKPPHEIYPKQKSAVFDVQGRPFSPFFYTVKATYYEFLHEIHSAFVTLNKTEDRMIEQGILVPPKEVKIDLTGTQWMTSEEVRLKMMEKITEQEYLYITRTLDRLAEHPYSSKAKDIFMRYRKDLTSVTSLMDVPPLSVDEKTGRQYSDAVGKRKNVRVKARIWENGTGKIDIDGKDLSYFEFFIDREQVMFPLQFCQMLNKVDVDINIIECAGDKNVHNYYRAAQAGAMRHAISLALRPFVDSAMVEDMRLAGLLTHDKRIPERKKPGQKGARRKFTWKKR